MSQSEELRRAKQKKLQFLEEKRKREAELPHLYGYPWYEWAWSFFTTKNKMALLTASNQSGKSSTQIRKVIHLATAVDEWPEWWDHRPRQFWWLYPNKHVATVEFYQKWVPEFLPRGSMLNHPQYGWRAEFDPQKKISEIVFNSGVSIYFRSYETDAAALQSGTVDYIACFPKGSRILTVDGLKNIEDIKENDYVVNVNSINKVEKTFSRKAKTIKRAFSNGISMVATPEHLFMTYNRGWVRFIDLTKEDRVVWKKPEENLERANRLFLWAFRTEDTQKVNILDTTIFKGLVANLGQLIYIGLCLNFLMGLYQKVTKYITLMETLVITPLRILSLYLKKNTLGSILTSIGKTKSICSLKKCVVYVIKSLQQIHPEENLKKLALENALKCIKESQKNVMAAAKYILNPLVPLEKTSVSVVTDVLEIVEDDVYCIKVDSVKSFFCNGFQVHNCDEELDATLYSELKFRTVATNGYFSLVFTATKGQEFWRLAMEPKDGEKEMFPHAWKRTVSMYDCMFYKDGRPGKFSKERIEEIKGTCKSEAEVQRRVMGRFVMSDNLSFPWYSPSKHLVQPSMVGSVPESWDIYAAVDLGSGALSESSHPAAIVFVGVNPEKTKARVFRAWRGDGEKTAAGDVYEQYKQMCVTLGREPVIKSYDYESADYGILVERAGDFWYRAEKNIARGQELVNSMFKFNVLTLDEGDMEIQKLSAELQSVSVDGGKDQRDDLVSALRYDVMKIPLDWNKIRELNKDIEVEDVPKQAEKQENDREQLRKRLLGKTKDVDFGHESVEQELEFWNEMLG
jgi:hypothetical protein